MGECEVYCGLGLYPIITKTGRELYSIQCPECCGDGLAAEIPAEGIAESRQIAKYEALMAEKRALSDTGER